ncbi:MAG: hypothetical protein AB9842_05535 [Bacteroidales bacterium]
MKQLQKLFGLPALLVLISSAFLAYIASKAYLSSFTSDESFTYLYYVHTSFMDIISFKGWYSNNHILNTLLMKYSESLFGTSEFSLRLPNVLISIVYLTYGFLLFRKSDKILALSLFILLLSNNLLADFFSMARGYGLSCAFMMMSLYHLIESYHQKKRLNIALFHLGALLSVLSHFTLLTFYAVLLFICIIIEVYNRYVMRDREVTFLRFIKLHLLPFLTVIIVLYEPIRRLLKYNSLDNGGKLGFFEDTLTHLIYNSFHFTYLSPPVLIFLKLLFTAVVLVSFVLIVSKGYRKDKLFFDQYTGFIITNLLLVFISISFILLHLIIHKDYPIGRFTLFLFPLFVVHLGFMTDYFSKRYKKKILVAILIPLALLSAVDFVCRANLRTCGEWGYDSETKNMVHTLSGIYAKEKDQQARIKIGVNWVFEPTINFYRETLKLDWLLPADRQGLTPQDDYYYVFKDDLKDLDPSSYVIIKTYDVSSTLLLKNIKPGAD